MKSPRDAGREQWAAWRRYQRACRRGAPLDVTTALHDAYGRAHIKWLDVHNERAAAKGMP